jgi:hypothetical protein
VFIATSLVPRITRAVAASDYDYNHDQYGE